ncbi:hypothetical protein J9978_15595 [Chromobacterium violaceum]|uniref:hypothetical protein n=1 Tax=Chromobacterium violaceum TaxID=536 RepID=UPI001B340E09|nr:hypothetical protein [Chromobacterium violaceum]MBP4050912.1 hypothetical protein [Chromobacterium violaceum]
MFRMHAIKPNKIVTRVLTVKPTEYSAPENKQKDIILLVEIEEKYNYGDGSVYEAQLDVRYELLSVRGSRERHTFDAHYRRNYQGTGGEVCITGKLHAASVFLDPIQIRGRRIGTYLMNEVIKWAKQWPLADVKPIRLSSNQAGVTHEFSTERRNRFYEQFGIEFDYLDPLTKASGRSKPMNVNQLKEVNSWEKNIEQHPISDYLPRLLQHVETLARERAALQDSVRQFRERAVKSTEAIGRRGWKVFRYTSLFWLVAVLVFLANNNDLIHL